SVGGPAPERMLQWSRRANATETLGGFETEVQANGLQWSRRANATETRQSVRRARGPTPRSFNGAVARTRRRLLNALVLLTLRLVASMEPSRERDGDSPRRSRVILPRWGAECERWCRGRG